MPPCHCTPTLPQRVAPTGINETDWVEGISNGATEVGASDWIYRVNATTAWTNAGGNYTATDGASTTVPADPLAWMDWAVTNQVQYAVTNTVDAHFLIMDGAEAVGGPAEVYYYSKEYTDNTTLHPKLAITYTAPWDSYQSDNSTVEDLYDSYGEIIHMKGTGFAAGSYKVRYWDKDGTQVGSDANITIGGGDNLSSHMACNTDEGAIGGTWHAEVYLSDGTTLIADDTFTVDQAAIPEFPTIMAAIGVSGLCFGIYYWMRRKRVRRVYGVYRVG